MCTQQDLQYRLCFIHSKCFYMEMFTHDVNLVKQKLGCNLIRPNKMLHQPKLIEFTIEGLIIGLSRLCSATFEQLVAFGATFCGFSNLEQVLPFRATFEQNIGLEHKSSTKKSTILWKTSIHANFLKAYHVINLLNT